MRLPATSGSRKSRAASPRRGRSPWGAVLAGAALLGLAPGGWPGPSVQHRRVWTAQPESPTVGDTVYLVRALPGPPGVRVRAQPLARTAAVEPLLDPQVTSRGDLLVLRYAVAWFEPGEQRLPMPAVELFYPDGSTETILGDTAVVGVRSVLPAGDSLPPPQPGFDPLPRPRRQPVVAIVLVLLVLAATGAWGAARRRVGPRPSWPPSGALEPAAPAVPLAAWVEAGELRAAASVVADEFRRALARWEPGAAALGPAAAGELLRRRRPDWPVPEIRDLLLALERARFAPAVPSDVLALAEQARMLIEQVERATKAGG